jgi:hypothetical protein
MELAELLHVVDQHFARYERPNEYIDATHCCECAEHYEELRDVTVGQLTKEHVGDGAWDPTCFLTTEGFRYYFPALVRIASADRDWIEMLAPRLVRHYADCFSTEDRRLVRLLLEAWWADEATPEWTRLAIERALDHYPAA